MPTEYNVTGTSPLPRCSVAHKSTRRSAQTVKTVQNSYYLVRAIARESVLKVSVPTYIQNRTHDEKYDDKWCELYHNRQGDGDVQEM